MKGHVRSFTSVLATQVLLAYSKIFSHGETIYFMLVTPITNVVAYLRIYGTPRILSSMNRRLLIYVILRSIKRARVDPSLSQMKCCATHPNFITRHIWCPGILLQPDYLESLALHALSSRFGTRKITWLPCIPISNATPHCLAYAAFCAVV